MRIGMVARIFRYPVKSMRGEELAQTPVGLQGLPGDRRYAFVQAGSRSQFPWLTGRELAGLLLHQPRYADGFDGRGREPALLVRTPDGRDLPVVGDELRRELEHAYGGPLFLLRDYRGSFDVAQVSIFDLGMARRLAAERGAALDPRRFRANFYLEPDGAAVPESEWVGRILGVGPDLRLAVTEPDQRCMMINLDPDSAEPDPAVLRTVAGSHANCVGVYASVLRPGVVECGDAVELLDSP
ncbi:MAG TPA: MOSC domain-containing protein [Dehalococcoidia bacterium]|nr:MOSC domain-containing protein [Dehalococcoidia bacterium]